MTNTIFKIMAFTLMLNFSVGILMAAFPQISDPTDPYYDPSYIGSFTYQEGMSNDLVSNMNGSMNPSGLAEDRGDQIYRVLDVIGLGFIQRFINTILNYLYGFIVLLDNIFGGMINPTLHALLFTKPVGLLYDIITIGYIYAGFQLWTGKDLTTSN